MGKRLKLYLIYQQWQRLMSCDHRVDLIFYRAFMRKQRLREKDFEYRTMKEEECRGRNMEEISPLLRSQGEFSSCSSPEPESSPCCKTGHQTTDIQYAVCKQG